MLTSTKQFSVLGRSSLAALLLFFFLAGAACRPKKTQSDLRVTSQFEPSVPSVGVTRLTVTLTDAEGRPVSLGELAAEANMNHAGMRPSFGQLHETSSGVYVGQIDFTMAGDWFILLSNARAGQKPEVNQKIEVAGVRAR